MIMFKERSLRLVFLILIFQLLWLPFTGTLFLLLNLCARQEMLHKFSKKSGLTANVYPTLQKMKIPAIVVSIILIVFEHTFAILRAFFVGGVSFTVYVTAILYLIVAITVGLFFFITGIRVLMMLRSLLKHNTKSQIIMRVRIWFVWNSRFCEATATR